MTQAPWSQDGRTAAAVGDHIAPRISVIVPIRNEEHCIAATLRQLVGQDYDPDRYEILVVDGASTDRTREIVAEFAARHPQVKLLDNPRRWSSSARNIGVRASRGDLILVVDAHCDLENDSYLDELVDAFRRSGADCIGRPQPLGVPGASRLQRAIGAARSSPLGHHPASFIYSSAEAFVPAHSVGVAYRREVFQRIDHFDEAFDACEDVEFNHRLDKAGLRCFLTPRLTVHYHPRGSLRALFRQLFRYGRGRGRLMRKHPETFSIGSTLPAALVAGLLGGLAIAAFSPGLALVYAALVLVYLAAVATMSLAVAWRQPEGWRLLPWLPLVFLTIHAGAGAGVLYEFLWGPPRQRGLECAAADENAPGTTADRSLGLESSSEQPVNG